MPCPPPRSTLFPYTTLFRSERVVNGTTLDFGTSGKLYKSDLVMYDRQSHSLWAQMEGRAIVGTYAGTRLKLIPAKDRKSTRLNSSHRTSSYAVFCLKKKKKK